MGEPMNIIIAGGGTGGHFYPALSIGNELREKYNAAIHYMGSAFGIESEKLPQLGLDYTLLPIRGLQRNFSFQSLGRNILLPGRLIKSRLLSNRLFNSFQPNAVIGTGGYASALPLHTAVKKNIPIFIQEQNSFPGITTRYFSEKSEAIYTAFHGVEKYVKKKTAFYRATRSEKILMRGIA